MKTNVRDYNPLIKSLVEVLQTKPVLKLGDFNADDTVLVIVDMVNGFAKAGSLFSERVAALIPDIQNLMEKSIKQGISVIAFTDSHAETCPEFTSYPVHCLQDSTESELLEELREIGGYKLIPKNSTNGFLEEEFQQWLKDNSQIRNFIVVGDCTDICVEQFSNTVKAYFNMKNLDSRVIIPVNIVDTFETDTHDGELFNLVALSIMAGNGIEIVQSIK